MVMSYVRRLYDGWYVCGSGHKAAVDRVTVLISAVHAQVALQTVALPVVTVHYILDAHSPSLSIHHLHNRVERRRNAQDQTR